MNTHVLVKTTPLAKSDSPFALDDTEGSGGWVVLCKVRAEMTPAGDWAIDATNVQWGLNVMQAGVAVDFHCLYVNIADRVAVMTPLTDTARHIDFTRPWKYEDSWPEYGMSLTLCCDWTRQRVLLRSVQQGANNESKSEK